MSNFVHTTKGADREGLEKSDAELKVAAALQSVS